MGTHLLNMYSEKKWMTCSHAITLLTEFSCFQNSQRVSVDSVRQSMLAIVTHSLNTGCWTDKLIVFIPLTLSCSASRKQNSLARGCELLFRCICTAISSLSLLVRKTAVISATRQSLILHKRYLSLMSVDSLIFVRASKECWAGFSF